MHRTLVFAILLNLWSVATARAQDLDSTDVHIGLEQALPIASAQARADFPDLNQYVLYSVHPRVLLGDPKGLFWEFMWQEMAFPHRKRLLVRVYLKDGATASERVERVSTPWHPHH